MAKKFMTQDEYDFLNRIHEKKGKERFASFSKAEVYGGEKPALRDVSRIRSMLMSGKKYGFWSYFVERRGRTEVTYYFKPLIKIVKED